MFGHWKTYGYWPGWEESGRRHRRRGYRRPKYNIPVNIIENEKEFEAWVYAISFPKETIKVSVVGDMLYISGTRTPEGDHSPNFLLQEYPIKSFERSFELSEKVDKAKIRAKHEHGILKIIAPKVQAETEPAQDIEVE